MQQELDGGLVMRTLSEGHPSDRENLARFYMSVFQEDRSPDEETNLYHWASNLISGQHPTTTLDDVWVVVDPAADDRIVSALLLIPQTWRYEDVKFGVGRVELVATDKDYRRRGLVRRMMDALHQRSTALGHPVQAITGIPYFYRQFGYALTVDLGTRAALALSAIPALKDDETSKYTLRAATVDDAAKLVAWDDYFSQSALLTVVRDEAQWRYDIAGRHPAAAMTIQIIVDREGQDVGHVALRMSVDRPECQIDTYVVGDQASYLDTFDDVFRAIKDQIMAFYAEREPDAPQHIRIESTSHETVDTLVRKLFPSVMMSHAYAWYLRVPDKVAFLKVISPVLERRLAGSGANRHTGTLRIGFYAREAVAIQFEDGRIVGIEAIPGDEVDAGFPDHTFLHVLFGQHTVLDLRAIYPDVWANRKAQVLIDILFPKRWNAVLPLS